MPIIPLHGHEQVRAELSAALSRDVMPAGLLLQGPRGVGKQRLALWLAQLLVCDAPAAEPCGECRHCRYAEGAMHPDIHWYFPRPRLKDGDASPADIRLDLGEAIAERAAAGFWAPPGGGESIYVATVRAIVASASVSPAMAARKVFVIGDAERMVPQEGAEAAANAFLKLLEEPPANTTLVLTSSEPGSLLPTIRSRVVSRRIGAVGDDVMRRFLAEPAVAPVIAEAFAGASTAELLEMAGGAPGRLLAHAAWGDALSGGRALLEAIRTPGRTAGLKAAFTQGGSRARGSFTDVLDAMTFLLHSDVRRAADRGDDHRAESAARAVSVVEEAKELASGNVNPQLITAHLVRTLGPLLQ
jgi:DNA polymerase III subunit delta'